MTEHVDPLDGVLKLNRRHTIFGGLLDYLRRVSCVISSAFGGSSELVTTPNNHSFVAMASAEPIDISSTDSEDSDLWEIEHYKGDDSPIRDTVSSINNEILPSRAFSPRHNFTGRNGLSREDPSSSKRQIVQYESPMGDVISSSSTRILPSWAASSHPNLTGYNDPSRKDRPSSSKRQTVHDAIPSRMQERLSIAETAGSSSSRIDNNMQQKVGSNNPGPSQPMKRALPASIQSFTSNPQSHNLIENVGASEIRETYGKSAWSNPSHGNRILPPTLMPGKHSSTTPFVGLNDSFHQTGVSEERPAGPDESFVFQAAVQDMQQPTNEASFPDGLLSVSLLRHQKIALAWMLHKESSGLCLGGILADDQGLGKTISTIALIQMQKVLEAKSKATRSCTTKTEAFNLDDDDGVSGCIVFDEVNQIKEPGDITILPEASNTIKGFQSRRPTAGTLIVCPASVVRQWARELDEKVTDKAKLTVLIYHGGNRTKDPAALAKYAVVITTYAIVTNEVPKKPLVEEDDDELKDGERYGVSSAFSTEKKRKKSLVNKKLKKGKKDIDMNDLDSNSGTLSRVKWSRVVLDESQTIKNHRTQVARACCSLRAKRRWCLSGTPIQNSIDELYSYFRFLRYDPYDKYKTFGSSIKAFIARDPIKGYQKLQFILKTIMLRRTKGTLIDGKPIINLPPKKVHLTKVEFSSEERAFYEKLEFDSRKQFKAYAAAGTVNQNYANILLMLLRLRQACDHPLLVKGLSSDPVGKVSSEMAKILPREMIVSLLKHLEASLAICLVCRDPPENAVVTMCGHVFCYQCVSDHLTGEDNTCPAPQCKEQLGADVVYSRSTLRRCLFVDVDGDDPVSYEPGDESVVLQRKYLSSKIKSALEIIKTHCISKSQSSESHDLVRCDGDASSSDGTCFELASIAPEKAIVFSQWTSMLDLVEMSLKNSHINYRRLDGTMSIAARDKAVKEFNTDPEVDVMLMSLKAGNLGLNMVAACRVILLDLWWNPTTEDQAIDRAHRIGQTRTVTVSRLTVKDTVEDRILALQEDKRKMVASAFGEDQSGGHGARLTMEDLRFLFEGSGR
ncbi:SNF2 domain-containing protein / helicase domain-containing protein / zinc finger protein-like protein [Perilla frutescens var. hirtella]|uniref:SNF2 domain-containing protein / helicase domain-containing protein / zinc finger protein-like protein n=1 Tax=Perilla frutescens var. hirtella TaxID=608512 RepID=A0AAD4JFC4_PERFH|nr:SNF2 domain-containing protein / helicase domain-containing protein / zinc finger protein-like protein [Perilla frutescens var. hirtella]